MLNAAFAVKMGVIRFIAVCLHRWEDFSHSLLLADCRWCWCQAFGIDCYLQFWNLITPLKVHEQPLIVIIQWKEMSVHLDFMQFGLQSFLVFLLLWDILKHYWMEIIMFWLWLLSDICCERFNLFAEKLFYWNWNEVKYSYFLSFNFKKYTQNIVVFMYDTNDVQCWWK